MKQKTLIDKIELLPEHDVIQVRERTDITDDDGKVLFFTYARYCLDSKADKKTLKDAKLQKIYDALYGA